MEFVNLHCHSHFSLLDGLSTCEQIAQHSKKLGYSAAAITDHSSISGHVEFQRECKIAGIKPIFGIEAYVSSLDSTVRTAENRQLTHLPILCKNKDGWKSLCMAVGASNSADHFYYKPRLSLKEWAKFSNGNWIVFSGHPGSTLASKIVTKEGYIVDNALNIAVESIKEHQNLFGHDNFRVEIQLVDHKNIPFCLKLANILREAAKITEADCIATADSHYPTRDDAADHRVLVCSSLGTTLNRVQSALNNDENVGMSSFFKSDNYHIPSLEEIQEIHKGFEQEIENTKLIADKIESFKLGSNPILPLFDKNIDANEELRRRCQEGWKNILKINKSHPRYQEYVDRIKHELTIICEANLGNYFLIVADICDFAREQGILTGLGRGSAAGCLISYLTGITQIDPIPYGLMFERFYNAGRNTKDKVSLPDIDLDFPPSERETIIAKMRDKYGHDCVAKIATFGRLQGRSALKEVLRVHEACNNQTMNEITKFIPDEARIADELQEMERNGEVAKIIYWAVRNNAKQLKQWVTLNEDGTCSGEFGKYFEQAIRLEGIYKNTSEHASGVIVAPSNLTALCPMIRGKHGELIAGAPYTDLEELGLCKIDILGVSAYEKLDALLHWLEHGDIYETYAD